MRWERTVFVLFRVRVKCARQSYVCTWCAQRLAFRLVGGMLVAWADLCVCAKECAINIDRACACVRVDCVSVWWYICACVRIHVVSPFCVCVSARVCVRECLLFNGTLFSIWCVRSIAFIWYSHTSIHPSIYKLDLTQAQTHSYIHTPSTRELSFGNISLSICYYHSYCCCSVVAAATVVSANSAAAAPWFVWMVDFKCFCVYWWFGFAHAMPFTFTVYLRLFLHSHFMANTLPKWIRYNSVYMYV